MNIQQQYDRLVTQLAGFAATFGSVKAYIDAVIAASVTNVTGTAPIVSSGGLTPAVSITAATGAAAGSMSAADKTKIDTVTSGAAVASVSGTAPIVSSGGLTPAVSITAATGAAAGSMSAADKTKSDAAPTFRILESSDQVVTTGVSKDLGPYTLNAGEVPLPMVYVTNAASGESYGEGSTSGTYTGIWFQRENGVANQFILRLFHTAGSNRTWRVRLWGVT